MIDQSNEPEKDQSELATSSTDQLGSNKILELLGFADSRDTSPRTLEQIVEDIRDRPEDEAARRDRL